MKKNTKSIAGTSAGTASWIPHQGASGLAMALVLAAFLLPARLPGQAEPSALFEVQSADKGFLPPRMTQPQRDAIASPAKSLVIFNTTSGCLEINQGSPAAPDWRKMNCPGTTGSLGCASATLSGTLTQGQPATGVSVVLPYTGGNGGTHAGLAASSTDVPGLTASLAAGAFAAGSGSLVFTITGTPDTVGTANFALDIGGQSCIVALTVTAGLIGNFHCSNAGPSSGLVAMQPAAGKSLVVSYSGGNGGPHTGQTLSSTGVTGLTATLLPGNFANGTGSLVYALSGTPATAGMASFTVSMGGQSCALNLTVVPHPPGAISELLCLSAEFSGPVIVQGQAVTGASASIPYSGGNGGPYDGQTVLSTGVVGLMAMLASGNFANGTGSLSYSISGFPASVGLASFPLEIGGRSCTLEVPVFPQPPGAISQLLCNNASTSGILIAGVPTALSVSVPYAGGNGGSHDGQTVSASAMNLTATLPAGNFANGSGQLVYEIIGTPAAPGTAGFSLEIGGQNCSLNLQVAPGSISSLDCAGAIQTGTLTVSQQATGVSAEVPYSGGNGGMHTGQVVNSTGATGLTATLLPGNFSAGSLIYQITGSPSAAGTASFALNIGGQSCTLALTVGSGAIGSLNCAGAMLVGTLIVGQPATGVVVEVPYFDGNGGPHAGQTVVSTGVTGLTALLSPGSFNNGNGTLHYQISGTPASAGMANFALDIGGQACPLSLNVNELVGSISTLDCFTASVSSSIFAGQQVMGVTVSLAYTGGNGGPHSGDTAISSGAPGLTLTLPPGNFANGSGTLSYELSGMAMFAGMASFQLNIGGQSCALNVIVEAPPPGVIGFLDCAGATVSGPLFSGQPATGIVASVPYTGGNGGSHSGDMSSSFGVFGLNASLPAGSFSNGTGMLEYEISGTPFSAGMAGFILNIGGQSCTLNVMVGN